MMGNRADSLPHRNWLRFSFRVLANVGAPTAWAQPGSSLSNHRASYSWTETDTELQDFQDDDVPKEWCEFLQTKQTKEANSSGNVAVVEQDAKTQKRRRHKQHTVASSLVPTVVGPLVAPATGPNSAVAPAASSKVAAPATSPSSPVNVAKVPMAAPAAAPAPTPTLVAAEAVRAPAVEGEETHYQVIVAVEGVASELASFQLTFFLGSVSRSNYFLSRKPRRTSRSPGSPLPVPGGTTPDWFERRRHWQFCCKVAKRSGRPARSRIQAFPTRLP
jgi:hypothetical protein